MGVVNKLIFIPVAMCLVHSILIYDFVTADDFTCERESAQQPLYTLPEIWDNMATDMRISRQHGDQIYYKLYRSWQKYQIFTFFH